MSKLVLGKGLGALIPGDENAAVAEKKYRMVALEQIAPNPMQPRRDFDEESLRRLADSFKANGIMQPLVVRGNSGGYTIIAGERRYRAAHLAGMKEVPVLAMTDIADNQMLELALVENLQREDLNPMETAEAYQRLAVECSLTQQQLAEKVGKSRAAVANMMRLLNLPLPIQQYVRQGKLSEGHARAILALGGESEMMLMAERIISDGLTVRQTETAAVTTKKRRLIPKRKLPALVEIENNLKQLLGTSVKIHAGLKRGRIEIEYYGDDDLERLLEIFHKLES